MFVTMVRRFRRSLSVCLEPGLVTRLAAEAFDLDPARLTVPPLDVLNLPHLRTAMLAVDAELTAGGAGDRWPPSHWPTFLAVETGSCPLGSSRRQSPRLRSDRGRQRPAPEPQTGLVNRHVEHLG